MLVSDLIDLMMLYKYLMMKLTSVIQKMPDRKKLKATKVTPSLINLASHPNIHFGASKSKKDSITNDVHVS